MVSMTTLGNFDIETIASWCSSAAWSTIYTARFELMAALVFVVGLHFGRVRNRKAPKLAKGKLGFSYPKVQAARKVQKKAPDAGSTRGCSALPISAATPELLTDHAWLLAQVAELCPRQGPQALKLYRSATQAGLNLAEVPAREREQLFGLLVPAAIRGNQLEVVHQLFSDLRQLGFDVSADTLASAVKLYTSKQLFTECLAIFDSAGSGSTIAVTDRSVWSCLLFCGMETKMYKRCSFFVERLKACGVPSPQDYNNMLRLAAHNYDWETSLAILQQMRDSNIEVYNVQYNTTLGTCVEAGRLDEARALLETMELTSGAADVITYNTVMKAHAKVGQIDECFELLERLRNKGIMPSQVTYGILADSCINGDQVDRAMRVFNDMAKGGCALNTVLYTMLIKGFIRAGNLKQAMNVYKQMRADGDAKISPDLITFSILIKANCDDDHLEDALILLGDMTDLRLKPDEVIFNNLMAGCGQQGNAKLGKQLYDDMIASGVRPSNVTFSILIRMYQKCKLFEDAVQLLKTEPARHKVEAESRLYTQLIHGCLRGRQGRRAIDVYEMLCGCSAPNAKVNTVILGTCMNVNMHDTAADIVQIAAANGARVDPNDINAIAEVAFKKGKSQLLQSCVESMQKLGHAVDPKFGSA